jgi:L-2-hydroxyglutarate oxidase
VPGAGIVDFGQVCQRLVTMVEAADGEFRTGARLVRLAERPSSVVLSMETAEIQARSVVNCSGLHSDRLVSPGNHKASRRVRIVPFRGEYHRLRDQRAYLVRSMIYPVPDPRFPFLGAHLTRSIGGEVHAGPNAVLALAREGYSWRDVDFADTWDLVQFPGFRRLLARHWRTGLGEVRRSLSARAFAVTLQRLVPEIGAQDLVPAPAGVRAQAVDRSGSLVEDFVLQESQRLVHVVNAPSPAATASLEIGRILAERTLERV